MYCSEISGNLLIVLKRSRLNLHDIPWGGFNSNTPRQSTFTVSEFVKKIRLTITETKNVSNSQFQTWFSRKTVIPLDTNSRNVSIICLYTSSILLLVIEEGWKNFIYSLLSLHALKVPIYIYIDVYLEENYYTILNNDLDCIDNSWFFSSFKGTLKTTVNLINIIF